MRMITLTDQTGRTLTLPSPARRIISVVTSQTELLYDLGLGEEVVGITRFCVHPRQWFNQKTRVGGTKDLKIDLIRSLSPDLIVANREENEKLQVEALQATCPVWTSDIKNSEDAYEMIQAVGQLTGKEMEAFALVSQIRAEFQSLGNPAPLDCLYLIWKNPYMAAGGDTFISHMLEQAGFRNMLAGQRRYPLLTETDIQSLEPAVLLLSSEPYPFRDKDLAELQGLLPRTRILLADGEMFSWYGSRMLLAPGYFQQLRMAAGKQGEPNYPFRH
jgi:ABC-type Fe3+-hydroxamate transport system substrate-binding protein